MLPTPSRNPLNRRTLLATAAGGGWLALSSRFAFAASDFWNKKEPSEWTPAEIDTLKTKSPWAKKVRGEMVGGGGSRGSGGSGGSGGGKSGGGGGGGRRGGGGGDSSDGGGFSAVQQGPEVVVRWENAAPMLEATKFQLPANLQNHYAISLTGLPPQMLAMVLTGARSGRGKADAPAAEAPTTPEEQQAQLKVRQDRLLHSVSLAVKGKDPQSADLVMQTSDKQTLIFGFSKDALPLAAGDKDVEFTMKAGPMTIKAKFEPKEMTWKGALTV